MWATVRALGAAARGGTVAVRVQKVVAKTGLCSRRKAEGLIKAGRVAVNGAPVALGAKMDPAVDTLTVDGDPLAVEPLAQLTYLLNKPAGMVSTVSDTHGRDTVVDALPAKVRKGMYPVGRLDRETEGLLLLTNDGALAHGLTHPSSHVEKEYVVRVDAPIGRKGLAKLASGVVLDGRATAPARVVPVAGLRDMFRITLVEGRNRQIRRMCEAVGSRVVALTRVRIGELTDSELGLGCVRRLSEEELSGLRRGCGVSESTG